MKRALIEAHQDSQLSDVYRYTFGIVFLGTPHRGSWSADFAHTLTKIIRVVPGNSNLLREVERNSSQLNEINYMFAHVVAQSLLIGLIYETQSTKPIGIVVERSSAILGFPSEICMSVDANHAQLCKFKGRDDLNYKQLSNLIANFREKTLQADVTLDRFPTSIWASSSPTSAKTANDHPIVAHPFPRATNPPQIGPTSTPPRPRGVEEPVRAPPAEDYGVSSSMDSLCCFQEGRNINGPTGNGWVHGSTEGLLECGNGHHRRPWPSGLTGAFVD